MKNKKSVGIKLVSTEWNINGTFDNYSNQIVFRFMIFPTLNEADRYILEIDASDIFGFQNLIYLTRLLHKKFLIQP